MKRIKEIKIKNFKAFQQEQSFLLNGKNFLVRSLFKHKVTD